MNSTNVKYLDNAILSAVIAKRIIDEDKVGIIDLDHSVARSLFINQWNGPKTNAAHDVFIENGYHKATMADEVQHQYDPLYGSVTAYINPDKLSKAKDIGWKTVSALNLTSRYHWYIVKEDGTLLELDGKVVLNFSLPDCIDTAINFDINQVNYKVGLLDVYSLWDVNRAAIKEHNGFVRVVTAEVSDETKELMMKHSIPNPMLSSSDDPVEIGIIKVNKVEPLVTNRFGSIGSTYSIPNNLPLSALIYRVLDKYFVKGEDLIDTIKNNIHTVRKLYHAHSEQFPPDDCDVYVITKFVNQYIMAQSMGCGPHYKPITTDDGKIYLKWVDGYPSTDLDVNQLKKDIDLTGIDEKLNGIQLIGSGLNGDYSEFALIASGTYTDENNKTWMKVFADHVNSMRADARHIHPTVIREYCNLSIAVAVKNADGKISFTKGQYPSVYEGYRGRIGVDEITKLRDAGKLKGPFLDIHGNLYYLLNVELAE